MRHCPRSQMDAAQDEFTPSGQSRHGIRICGQSLLLRHMRKESELVLSDPVSSGLGALALAQPAATHAQSSVKDPANPIRV